jgi:NADPH-dependent curcumin reductase CurA
VIDDFAQGAFQFESLGRVEVAFKDGELEVVAEVATGFENAPEPFIVGDVITNQVRSAHRSPR